MSILQGTKKGQKGYARFDSLDDHSVHVGKKEGRKKERKEDKEAYSRILKMIENL